MDERLPKRSVLSKLAPLSEIRRDAHGFERFSKCSSPCHLWTSNWPWMRHPTGKEFPGDSAHVHARYVTSPTEKSGVVVEIEGLDAEAIEQVGRMDVMSFGVGHGDAAHGASTSVVERAQTAIEVFS